MPNPNLPVYQRLIEMNEDGTIELEGKQFTVTELEKILYPSLYE